GCHSTDKSIDAAMRRDSAPESRTTPNPPRPGGVEMAAIVSSVFNGGGAEEALRPWAGSTGREARHHAEAPEGRPSLRDTPPPGAWDRSPCSRSAPRSDCATPDGSRAAPGCSWG